jgi:hypothetical protein
MLVQGGRWAQADTSLRLGVSATWPGSAGAKASADLPPQQQKEGCRVLLAQFCRRAQLLRSRRTPASSPSPTSLWRLCAGLPPEQSQLPSSLAKRPSLQRMRPPSRGGPPSCHSCLDSSWPLCRRHSCTSQATQCSTSEWACGYKSEHKAKTSREARLRWGAAATADVRECQGAPAPSRPGRGAQPGAGPPAAACSSSRPHQPAD